MTPVNNLGDPEATITVTGAATDDQTGVAGVAWAWDPAAAPTPAALGAVTGPARRDRRAGGVDGGDTPRPVSGQGRRRRLAGCAGLSVGHLGEAARKAREAIRQRPGDPTWLACTLYGDPVATPE